MKCPKCGARSPNISNLRLFPPIDDKEPHWRCYDCGHRWVVPEDEPQTDDLCKRLTAERECRERAELDVLRLENILTSCGCRRCDIPACNRGSYHNVLAGRLRDERDSARERVVELEAERDDAFMEAATAMAARNEGVLATNARAAEAAKSLGRERAALAAVAKLRDELRKGVLELYEHRVFAGCWVQNDGDGDCGNWDYCDERECPLKRLGVLAGITPQADGGVDRQPVLAATGSPDAGLASVEPLRKALGWIGNQPCRRLPEDDVTGPPVCPESQDCLTEYCLPCYARAVLAATASLDTARVTAGMALAEAVTYNANDPCPICGEYPIRKDGAVTEDHRSDCELVAFRAMCKEGTKR